MLFVYWFLLAILTAVTVFGAAMILNMLTRRWWVSLALWLAVSTWVLVRVLAVIKPAEWSLYAAGWVGAGGGALVSRWMQATGYPVFRRNV